MLQIIYNKEAEFEAGCDEAGRGALAGPVCASAVILPTKFKNREILKINDSKQISEKQRYYFREIIEKEAISYAVAFVDNDKIDKINILNASILAMHLALEKLNIIPQNIIVDGNRFKQFRNIPHICIVKGDTKFLSIAAASILAKTYRDDYMKEIHTQFPEYLWNKNKGYPTREHRKFIELNGTTKLHRKTFRLLAK